MSKKRKRPRRTPAQERSDREFTVRRILGLAELYEQMMETHLASEVWDAPPIVRRPNARMSALGQKQTLGHAAQCPLYPRKRTLILASGPALPNVHPHMEATQLQNSSEAYFCPNTRQL